MPGDLFDFEDAVYEGVDVLDVVVERQGGTHGALDVVVIHDGLGAVVAGTDSDAHLIQQGAHVIMVDAIH